MKPVPRTGFINRMSLVRPVLHLLLGGWLSRPTSVLEELLHNAAVQLGLEHEASGLGLGPAEDVGGVLGGVSNGARQMRMITMLAIVQGRIGDEQLLVVVTNH